MRWTIALLACALPLGAQAQSKPKLMPYAIDGDSIALNNQDIRLWGIDAPELAQLCGDIPHAIEAGKVARAYLNHLIDNKPIRCTYKDRDRYGRAIMLCRNHEGSDIGRKMVEAGWAWAYVQYAVDYLDAELRAREQKLGVHHMQCAPPWQWREYQRKGGGAPVPRR